MVQFLVDSGVDLNVQDVEGSTALHCAAHEGHIEPTRILLNARAAVDLENTDGMSSTKLALVSKHFAILELHLRHGASPHRAAKFPADMFDREWTAKEKKHAELICAALEARPAVVHLLADHGGICEKEKLELDFQMGEYGHTQVLRALRQAGCDAWCSGGGGINKLRTKFRIDGTKLLGAELVGHALQVRLRPAQRNDPLGLDRGARVAVYGLTSAAGQAPQREVRQDRRAARRGEARPLPRLLQRREGVQAAQDLQLAVDRGSRAGGGRGARG